MGEYLTIDNQEVKIGTCENLYYARIEDLQQHSYVEGIEEYINPDHGFRYRFPFPDEDNIGIGYDGKDYDRGLTLNLSPDRSPLLLSVLKSEEWNHSNIYHACGVGGAYNVNVWFPCIQSPKFAESSLGTSPHKSNPVQICQQKQVNGEIWTVIRCGYCGAKIRIDWPMAHELIAECIAMAKSQTNEASKCFWMTVAQRISDGYTKSKLNTA